VDEETECRSLYFCMDSKGNYFYSNRGNTHAYAYNIGVEMTDHKYVLLIL